MLWAWYPAVLVAAAHVAVIAAFARGPEHRALQGGMAAAVAASATILVRFLMLVANDMRLRDTVRDQPGHFWGDTTPLALLADAGRTLAPTVPVAVAGAGLAIVGVARLGRTPAAALLALVTALGVSMAAGADIVRLKPYYLLFVLPFAAILATAGAVGGPGQAQSRWRRFADPLGAALLALGVAVAREPVFPVGDDAPRDLGATIRQQGGADLVVVDPDMLHTLLLYYAVDEPVRRYHSCERYEGGQICGDDAQRLVTLTDMARMSDGWEARSVERFRALRDRPLWLVYTTRFANEPLLAEVKASCELRATFDRETFQLYRCPPWPG